MSGLWLWAYVRKQLRAVINHAVAVAVQHQECVVTIRGPRYSQRSMVGPNIKHDAIGRIGELKALAFHVNNHRVAWIISARIVATVGKLRVVSRRLSATWAGCRR